MTDHRQLMTDKKLDSLVAAYCQFDGVEQGLVVHGFAEIGNRPPGQRAVMCLHGIVAGDDHDGNWRDGLREPGLHLEPFMTGMCRSSTTQSGRRVSMDSRNSIPDANV